MRFIVTIDRDEDGVWVVECPSIPGCVSQGATKDEAIENVKDAIKQCLEARAGLGLPVALSTEERLARLRRAKGIWKDREDLPTLSELRGEWDRRNIDQGS